MIMNDTLSLPSFDCQKFRIEISQATNKAMKDTYQVPHYHLREHHLYQATQISSKNITINLEFKDLFRR